MNKEKTRVIYLSSTSQGQELLSWLQGHCCEVVFYNTENQKINDFPDYDLGISFLYTHKIPSSEFKTPFKWVNFHPGPLPEYRGRNLAYHAIIQQSDYFGASVHYMNEEFDTGEIIEVIRFPIQKYHTAGDLVTLSHKILGELFKKYIPQLIQGKVSSYPQQQGNYFYREKIDNLLELTQEQEQLIRALTVFPKFHPIIDIGGKKYKIIPES